MAYSKLHSSLVNSSLWTESDHVRLLFITLLAMCDKDGCVYGSRSGLARAAMINPDTCKERDPWNVLMSPDPESCDRMRAPENEGRRIEEIPGGFRLLNFAYYRGLRNEDDRREQNRLAQERFKAKKSHGKPPQAVVSHDKPPKAHTDTDTDTKETNGCSKLPPTPEAPKTDYPEAFEKFWQAYPRGRDGRRKGKKTSLGIWRRIPEAERQDVQTAVEAYAAERPEFVRDPERFLKADWWRDWLEPAEKQTKSEFRVFDNLRKEIP